MTLFAPNSNFVSLTELSIPLSRRIFTTSYLFSLLIVTTHALHLTSLWSNHLRHSKSLIAHSDMLHLISGTTCSFLRSLRIPHQNYSTPSHVTLTWYTLLSHSITFSMFHSKRTFSENLILHLSLFLSVGLISCL